MGKTRDEEFTYRGRFDHACRCRLRVWEAEGRPTVAVFSQLPDYWGPSVTNRIEWLAWEVWGKMGFPPGLVVLQHYPDRGPCEDGVARWPGSVDSVTFAPDVRGGFHDPRWQPMSRADAGRMLGEPLQD